MPTPAEQARARDRGQTKELADMIESALEEHIARGATRVSLTAYQGQSYPGKDTLGHGFLPHGTTYAALQAVKARYEAVGWNVNLNNSQRDGMYLVINAGGPA